MENSIHKYIIYYYLLNWRVHAKLETCLSLVAATYEMQLFFVLKYWVLFEIQDTRQSQSQSQSQPQLGGDIFARQWNRGLTRYSNNKHLVDRCPTEGLIEDSSSPEHGKDYIIED